jgi:putative zinc finger/helix-turn-helix YgiT family protein
MSSKNNVFSLHGLTDIACPACGKNKISTRKEKDSFSYGIGKSAVELTATIPVHRCEECNFEFTGDEADLAKHEAICRYLDVSKPADVMRVRERYGLTQREFARITRIGQASINRWENGQLIQSGAMDQYLYLLTFPENFERIRNRKKAGERSVLRSENLSWTARFSERFVALREDDDRLLEQAEAFSL